MREDLYIGQYLPIQGGALGRIISLNEGVGVTVENILTGLKLDYTTQQAELLKMDFQSNLVRAAANMDLPDGFTLQVVISAPGGKNIFNETSLKGDPKDRISNS